jgi:hypothetical protein
VLTTAYDNAQARNPKRVIFAEAEEEVVLRAAIASSAKAGLWRRRCWSGATMSARQAQADLGVR